MLLKGKSGPNVQNTVALAGIRNSGPLEYKATATLGHDASQYATETPGLITCICINVYLDAHHHHDTAHYAFGHGTYCVF